MADDATNAPAEGDVATATPADSVATEHDQVRENAEKAEERHGQVDVRDLVAEAAEAGDPYFGEYAEDPDDDRASKGVREPRPIDPGTAKQLGVEFNG